MTAITRVNEAAIVNVEYFSDKTIDAFIASRHSSSNTARTYRNSLRQMLKFFALKSITEPTTADVDAFINDLRGAKKSDSTLRLYMTIAKLFFSFLAKNRVYRDVAADCEPLKLRKAMTHKKKSLSTEQAKKLLSAVKGDSLTARRDRAIIALCLQTGLRTCEVSRASVGNFKDAGDYWTLDVIGKGHLQADATVKVAPVVAELILSYLNLRGKVADSEPLFVSTSHNVKWTANSYGVRLSEQSIGKMIRRNMISVGIVKPAEKDAATGKVKRSRSPISPHSCRHFAATTAIKSGVDIREVGAMLRHTSIVITSTYLHDLSLETRRAELAVADALFGAA